MATRRCFLPVAGAVLALGLAPFAHSAGLALALHPDNPHYFLWRGEPTVLVTSGEHYGAVMNLDFDYIRYLDELKACGLNLTRSFSGTYREVAGSFRITGNTLAPAADRYHPILRPPCVARGARWQQGAAMSVVIL